MKTTAYRVREVLRGHSAAASIIAVDSEGREVRRWATVSVPQSLEQAEPAEPDEPLLGRSDPESTDELGDDGATRTIDDELKEFKALMGLQ